MATILVTTSTFPRWADDIGSARFVFDLSLQMAQHHQVIVLAPHAPGAAHHETLNGLDVWRFPYFRPHRLQALCNGSDILPAIRSGLLPKCQVPFLFLNQLFWLNRMVRRFRVDLINSHWMIPQGFTTALLKKRFPGGPGDQDTIWCCCLVHHIYPYFRLSSLGHIPSILPPLHPTILPSLPPPVLHPIPASHRIKHRTYHLEPVFYIGRTAQQLVAQHACGDGRIRITATGKTSN